jgi:hypothetical protein
MSVPIAEDALLFQSLLKPVNRIVFGGGAAGGGRTRPVQHRNNMYLVTALPDYRPWLQYAANSP